MQVRHIGFFKKSTNQPFTKLGNIDPVALDEPSRMVIEALMQDSNVGEYYEPGEYLLTISNADHIETNYSFTCQYGLGINKDKYGNLICKVRDMTSTTLGSGISGSLYPTLGKIIFRYDEKTGLRFEDDKHKHVLKISTPLKRDESKHRSELASVFPITQHIPHVRARMPFVGRQKNGSMISCAEQRRHEGVSLFELINANITLAKRAKLTSPLNMDDRFQIMIALFKALKKQVFENGVIHRDIKTENIMVFKGKNGWEINIIDFDFAQNKNEIDGKCPGTAAFISKEGLSKQFSEASDIFAMALSVGLLWHDKVQVSLLDLDNTKLTIKKRIEQNWLVKFDIGNEINELDTACKEDILKLLTPCVAVSATDRPDIDACIEAAENAYLAFKMRHLKIPSDDQLTMTNVQLDAQNVRKALARIRTEKVDKDLIEGLRDQLTEILGDLPENSDILNEFLTIIDVECLKGSKTKMALISNLNETVSQFFIAYDDISNLYAKMATLKKQYEMSAPQPETTQQLNSKLLQLHQFCKAILNTPIDFDLLKCATDHMIGKLHKEEKAYQYFTSLLPQAERTEKSYTI